MRRQAGTLKLPLTVEIALLNGAEPVTEETLQELVEKKQQPGQHGEVEQEEKAGL
jgi:chromosome segregation and condensation protein ScpB